MSEELGMNIYALKGHRVRCIHLQSPYNYETEKAQKYLVVGTEYTVEHTEVFSENTEVYLEEIPGISFNSTCFEDVKKQSKHQDKQHPDYVKYHPELQPMTIVSTNIGEPCEVDWKGKKIKTGIFKYATDNPIFLDIEKVAQDSICDRNYHGGEDQAVYAFSFSHYSYFIRLFHEADWEPGMFGENLTVENLDETTLHVGDTFQVGECILEVTKPRDPCMKLGIRFNNMKIIKEFWNTTYSGVYFKVLKTGYVNVGDTFVPIKKCPQNKTIAQLFEERRALKNS